MFTVITKIWLFILLFLVLVLAFSISIVVFIVASLIVLLTIPYILYVRWKVKKELSRRI